MIICTLHLYLDMLLPRIINNSLWKSIIHCKSMVVCWKHIIVYIVSRSEHNDRKYQWKCLLTHTMNKYMPMPYLMISRDDPLTKEISYDYDKLWYIVCSLPVPSRGIQSHKDRHLFESLIYFHIPHGVGILNNILMLRVALTVTIKVSQAFQWSFMCVNF